MKKKKLLGIILCMSLALCFLVVPNSFAGYNPSATVVLRPPFKNLDTFKESELPEQVVEWAKRWKTDANTPPREVMKKVFDATHYLSQNCFYNLPGSFDDGIRFTVRVPDRDNYEFTIVLTEHRYEDNKIWYQQKNSRKEISPAELDKIKLFWANIFCEAADHHVRTFNTDIPLRDSIIKHHEAQLTKHKLLEKPNLEEMLAGKKVKIDGFEFLLEESMFIPSEADLSFASFMPKLAIITPSETVYGLSYIEAGVIMLHPAGVIIENLLGINDVATHEQFHRNKFLQGFLWNGGFDCETWAALSERKNHNWFEFLFHPYLKPICHASKIITSFDAEEAKKEMFLMKTRAMGARDINDLLFDEYAIRAEKTFRTMREALFGKSGFITHFYSDPIYWNAVNERLNDRNAAIKVFLYSRFAFSLLRNPQDTKQWLEENEALLIKAYEETIKDIKKESAPDQEKYAIQAALREFDEKALLEVAQLLNLRASSMAELVKQIETLIKIRVISCPRVRVNIDSMGRQ